MAVTIVIPTPLRQFAGGKSEIEVEAKTAGEALEKLTAAHADLKKHLYNDGGNLRNFVNVYVGDEDIRDLDNLETPSQRRRRNFDRSVNCGRKFFDRRSESDKRFAGTFKRRNRALFAAFDLAGSRSWKDNEN